jgi:hypothetical protein
VDRLVNLVEEERMDAKDPGVEKNEVKKHIRVLKAKRDEAIKCNDYKDAKQSRRGIRALKRRSRVLARAVKAAQAAAAATPTSS